MNKLHDNEAQPAGRDGGTAPQSQVATRPDLRYRFAMLPSGRLSYVEVGSGSPVILVHGSYGSLSHWIANIEAIAASHRVIALDLPGFGQSFAVPQSSELDIFARAVEELAIELGLDHFALGGFSFGGLVCAQVLRSAPQLISGLFLVSPPLPGAPAAAVARIQQEIGALAIRKPLRESVVATLEKLFLFNKERITEEAIEITAANIQATQFRARPVIGRSNLVAALAPVRSVVPMRFMIGAEDPFHVHGSEEIRRALLDTFGRDQVRWIPHAAHWACYDRPEGTNALIAEFLSQTL